MSGSEAFVVDAVTLREADGSAEGEGWRLSAEPRRLDAAVVRTAPGRRLLLPPGRVHEGADALLKVLDGSGELRVPDRTSPLAPGGLVWLAGGSGAVVVAGVAGLECLVVRARPGVAQSAVLAASGGVVPGPGGDPACLLHQVCADCGRMSTESDARHCAGCGAPLAAGDG